MNTVRLSEVKMSQEQLAKTLERSIGWTYEEAMEFVVDNELEDLNDVVCIIASRVKALGG